MEKGRTERARKVGRARRRCISCVSCPLTRGSFRVESLSLCYFLCLSSLFPFFGGLWG